MNIEDSIRRLRVAANQERPQSPTVEVHKLHLDAVLNELENCKQLICQKDEALKLAQQRWRTWYAENTGDLTKMTTPFCAALSPTITSQYVKKEVVEKLAGILKQSLTAYEYKDKFRPHECDNEMAQIREALSLYEQSTT